MKVSGNIILGKPATLKVLVLTPMRVSRGISALSLS